MKFDDERPEDLIYDAADILLMQLRWEQKCSVAHREGYKQGVSDFVAFVVKTLEDLPEPSTETKIVLENIIKSQENF